MLSKPEKLEIIHDKMKHLFLLEGQESAAVLNTNEVIALNPCGLRLVKVPSTHSFDQTGSELVYPRSFSEREGY